MSTVTETAQPLRYRGSHARYTDIAVRGENEYLGFAVEYAVHPSGAGCFVMRFVAHGKELQPFTHLTYRQRAEFYTQKDDSGKHAEIFRGVRLNKIAVKVCSPAVHPWDLDEFALKHDVWLLLEKWVAEQVKAEGFTLTVDLFKEVREMVLNRMPTRTPIENSTCVIEFPVLEPPKQAAPLTLVQKPEPDEDDTDVDGDDGDDEDEDTKEWLN